MSDLDERKRRFMELLLTLGGLLTVFLGFLGQSSPWILWIKSLGILFVTSALLSYGYLLFYDRMAQGTGMKLAIDSTNALVGASFAGLVLIGLGDVFTGAGAGNILLTIIILAVLYSLFFLIAFFVIKILGLKERE